jgi:hypothetical protein
MKFIRSILCFFGCHKSYHLEYNEAEMDEEAEGGLSASRWYRCDYCKRTMPYDVRGYGRASSDYSWRSDAAEIDAIINRDKQVSSVDDLAL